MQVKLAEPIVIEEWPLLPEEPPKKKRFRRQQPRVDQWGYTASQRADFLEKMYKILDREHGWTQGARKRGMVYGKPQYGYAYCLLGAADATGENYDADALAAWLGLDTHEPEDAIAIWNDNSRRTQKDVLNRLKARITKYRNMYKGG